MDEDLLVLVYPDIKFGRDRRSVSRGVYTEYKPPSRMEESVSEREAPVQTNWELDSYSATLAERYVRPMTQNIMFY